MKTPSRPKQKRALRESDARKRPRRGQAAGTTKILGQGVRLAAALEGVPAKWRWHHRVLVSLQNRLLGDRADLLRSAAEPLEPHSLDEADSATDEFEHDLALTQLSAEQDALYEVNEALKRIRDGSYGVCEESGEAIPAARLRAVPWARFTREVEERLERKGVVGRARVSALQTVRGTQQASLAPEEEAEETEEKPPPPPKDEALSQVFSPPGRHVSAGKTSQRAPRRAKRKGRTS
jgi:RNA polymerase-binding transcription factor DksA